MQRLNMKSLQRWRLRIKFLHEIKTVRAFALTVFQYYISPIIVRYAS